MASQWVYTTQKIQDSHQLAISWKVFWDSEGMIHVNFLPHGVTINA
jgi:hypothetical protein